MSQAGKLPKSYKVALVKEKKGPFEILDRPLELPQEGQVLVKVLACGICHSDSIVKEGIMPVLPRVPGHEIVGDVAAVPSGEKKWKVGDRVGAGWHGGHCHVCDPCRRGKFNLCEKENITGVKSDGGYAEYALLRTESLASIPTDMDPAEAAPLLCAGVTTYNSLRNTGAQPSEVVAVSGVGGLGHLAVQFASKMGYQTVAISSSNSKEKLAKSLGAHHYIDTSKMDAVKALKELGGAKVIMATAPHADSISPLIDGFATDGTLLLLAILPEPLSVSTMSLIHSRSSVQGWPSGSAVDSEDTVKFAAVTGVRCQIERFKLNDVQKGYDKMMSNQVKFRGVLVFD